MDSGEVRGQRTLGAARFPLQPFARLNTIVYRVKYEAAERTPLGFGCLPYSLGFFVRASHQESTRFCANRNHPDFDVETIVRGWHRP